MEHLDVAYATLGSAAAVLALVGRHVRRWPISGPLVALLLGVALGPHGLRDVDLSVPDRDRLLLEGTRFLLAWSVVAAALRFPAGSLRPLLRPVLLLLGVALPLAAVLGAATVLVTGAPVAVALVVGACLSPTDPVLAASVVSGDLAEQSLPDRLRQLLTVESGANDGLGLPVVLVALSVLLPTSSPGGALLDGVRQVLVAVAVGAAVGALAGWALRAANGRDALGRGPRLVFTLLLATAVLGLCRLLDSDGVLGAFVAGLAYNRLVPGSDRSPEDAVDEAVNRYVVLPLFLVLGAVLPWADWAALGWSAVVFVLLLLLVRRMPVVLGGRRLLGLSGRDAAFAGWFGPMGVSAVFYLAQSLDEGADEQVFTLGTLAVTASVVAYGVSAAPLTRWYARRS